MIDFVTQLFVCLAAYMFFAARRGLFALKFFQQQEYKNGKFLRFIFRRAQLVDKIASISAILLMAAAWRSGAAGYAAAAVFVATGIFAKNPMKSAKKKLVMTARVQRIYWTAMFLMLAVAAAAVWAGAMIYIATLFFESFAWFLPVLGATIILANLPPFALILSNFILSPVEWMTRRKYLRQAQKKLVQLNPICIGITGSFGKTSTKNILAHILQSAGMPVYATARSINTLMGVSRVIREDLKPQHKYFIVEMGTDHPGSIPALCKLIRPQYGILTAVGAAHYENFKSVDNVAREKFSLAKSIAENGGQCVINVAQVAPELIKKYAPADYVTVPDGTVHNISVKADGLHFEFKGRRIFAPVYGAHAANNIALAITTAEMLGISMDTIMAALSNLPQTEHRLEVRSMGKMTLIDDGFNSNLDGFISAIDTARILADANNSRAIIITPGMVELGEKHDAYHKTVGEHANKKMDIVIVVAGARIPSFSNQIDSNKLVSVASKSEADKWLAKNAKPGDVVLYENDLPDLFEETIII